MTPPVVSWVWPGIAGAATVVAVAASAVPAVAVPAAGAAVIAAGLAVAHVVRTTSVPRARPRGFEPWGPVGVRDMFRAGRLGREDLLLLVDWLERQQGGPAAPTPEPAPERLLGAPPDSFRAYLASRLHRIEGTS